MVDPDVTALYDDDESFVEGEDLWSAFDPVAVVKLEAHYERVLTTSDPAERLAKAKALVAEMNT